MDYFINNTIIYNNLINNGTYIKSCLEFIENNYNNEIKNQFLKQLILSNFEILNKLLIAIVREDIIEVIKNDEIQVKLIENSNNIINFKITNQNNIKVQLIIPIKDVFTFNRFTISNYPTLIINNGEEIKEIILYDCNDTLSKTISLLNLNEIKNQAFSFKSILEFVNYKLNNSINFDSNLFYEQLHNNGHFIHPSAKLKIGFKPSHFINYSNEFNKLINYQIIAIKNEFSKSSSLFNTNHSIDGSGILEEDHQDDDEQFIFKLFPNLKNEIIKFMNDDFNDYKYHLSHPWQVENVIPELYKNEINEKLIIILPPISNNNSIKAKPLISIRTASIIIDDDDDEYQKDGGACFNSLLIPHIKTPINVQMTCALRTISPHTAYNGPLFSNILIKIQEIEKNKFNYNQFGDSILFLPEIHGCWYTNKNNENDNDFNKSIKYKSLTNVWRDNPNKFITNQKNQQLITSCSLYSNSPISNKLILYEIIDNYIIKNQGNNQEEEEEEEEKGQLLIIKWFKLYINKLLLVSILLMSKYGIGLEAHLQNTIWVIDSETFEPIKLIVKDWGGVRICLSRLIEQGIDFNYLKGTITISLNGDTNEMIQKVLHSVINCNIGELILSISKQYHHHRSIITESNLWNLVKIECNSIFSKLKDQNPNISNQISNDQKSILFSKTIEIKSLTKMRLKSNNSENLSFKILNPLY